MEIITSRQNPLMQRLVRLGSKPKERRAQGEFICDGDKLLEEALKSGAELRTVVFAEGKRLPLLPDNVRCVCVPERLLESVSPVESPQGVLFTCAYEQKKLDISVDGVYLLLDGVQDAGNVGTILRSAEAFGLDAVLLRDGCADPFGPKAVRASMGAIFRQSVGMVDLEDLKGLNVYAADCQGEDIRNVVWGPCVVAIGREGTGLSREMLEIADKRVTIPMKGQAESLNAAAAATVILWEMIR